MMVYRRRFKTESEDMFDEARMSRICAFVLVWAGAAVAALPFMALIGANEAELATAPRSWATGMPAVTAADFDFDDESKCAPFTRALVKRGCVAASAHPPTWTPARPSARSHAHPPARSRVVRPPRLSLAPPLSFNRSCVDTLVHNIVVL